MRVKNVLRSDEVPALYASTNALSFLYEHVIDALDSYVIHPCKPSEIGCEQGSESKM